jgi:transcriptional regulator NrdR family protein
MTSTLFEWQTIQFKVTCGQCGNEMYVTLARQEMLPYMGQCSVCLNFQTTERLAEMLQALHQKKAVL